MILTVPLNGMRLVSMASVRRQSKHAPQTMIVRPSMVSTKYAKLMTTKSAHVQQDAEEIAIALVMCAGRVNANMVALVITAGQLARHF